MAWVWWMLAVLVGIPGLALVIVGLRTWLLPAPASRFLGFRPLLAWLVRTRLGGYRHVHSLPAADLPRQTPRTHRVAVVGGGIAGLSAATALAERGVSVTVLEANTYLGGKIGAWPVTFPDGGTAMVEHGFHAYFRHYWNWTRFLRETLGVYQGFRPIEEYLIRMPDGRSVGFGGVESTPALNIVHLAWRGVYDWRAIVRDPVASKRMEALLRYDPDSTYEKWDDISFESFIERAGIGPDLARAFTSFSRAFFADPDKMSMAELIKSFHFYYLSHDEGLEYDFPTEDHHRAVLEPWRRHLEAHDVELRLGAPVDRISRVDGGYAIGEEWFDEVVLAAHLPGVQSIVAASPDLERGDPDLARRLKALPAGQRYAVWRIWLDRDIEEGLPQFTVTDRVELLDSVTTFHRYEAESRAWVEARGGGSVLELHCYALPDSLDDEGVPAAFLRDLHRFFPELEGARILREYLQIRGDFPAFHTGLYRHRPGVETALPGLYLAGDWVKMPFPSMLMEAAFTSGLLAANAILDGLGVQGEPIYRVPLEGLLAGVPGEEPAPAA
jgi:carotenoid phi-ring synthase / carotenoid chi-ring synthase